MKFRNQGRGRYSQGDILQLDGVEIERELRLSRIWESFFSPQEYPLTGMWKKE